MLRQYADPLALHLNPPPDLSWTPSPHLPSTSPEMVKLLPLEERGQYQSLVDGIAADVERTRKHSGVAEFVKHISLVHCFIARGNRNDPLRGVICGVEFGRGFVLVNTDRLKRVLFRSKSCMNGCWQRLGYDVMRPSNDLVTFFTRLLPNVNPEFFAIRQWCVRLVHDGNTVCFASNLPDSFSNAFEVEPMPAVPLQSQVSIGQFVKPQKADFNFLDIRSLLNRTPVNYP